MREFRALDRHLFNYFNLNELIVAALRKTMSAHNKLTFCKSLYTVLIQILSKLLLQCPQEIKNHKNKVIQARVSAGASLLYISNCQVKARIVCFGVF